MAGADVEVTATGRPRVLVRAAVYGYLAVLVLGAALAVNWWPLTTWQLFSGTRGPTVAAWSIRTVNRSGTEEAFDPASAGRAFHLAARTADHWDRYSPARRAAVCRAWASAAERMRPHARSLRLYRTVLAVPKHDTAPRLLRARLRYECQVGAVAAGVGGPRPPNRPVGGT